MAWDPTQPVTGAALTSAPMRANFDALDTTMMAPVTSAAAQALVYKGAAGALASLPIGTTGHVLTVVAGAPAWQASTALSNPMSAVGDLIRGTTAGAAQRLAIGTAGQVLTVVSNNAAWATPSTMSNPMTTAQDLIVGGASGVPARLARGSNGQVLSVASNTVVWATPSTMSNPMSAVGDLIVGTTAGAPARLAAVATGAVLASAGVATAPTWSVSPALTDVKLGGGAIGTSGVGVLALGPSTAPTTSPVDTVQLWTQDQNAEAGSRALKIRDERGGTLLFGALADGWTYLQMAAASGGHTLTMDIGSGSCDIMGTVTTTLWGGSYNISVPPDGLIAIRGLGSSIQRILGQGAPDSGGAGYRQLLIAN